MKKLVSFLVGIVFIMGISFSSVFAQGRIGLNIKGFLGVGDSSWEYDVDNSISKDSDFTVPQFALGATYQISPSIPVEVGIFFHYNEYEFEVNKLDIDASMTKIALEVLYTFPMISVVNPYVAVDFFPYASLGDDLDNIDETFMGISGTIGAKYTINSLVSVLAQISYEHLFEEKNVSFNNFNILFGAGISL